MRANRVWWTIGLFVALFAPLTTLGCRNTPIDVSFFSRGPAPLREPGPVGGHSYEDNLQGFHVFQMYCASCHNARSLAERPFSSYQNVAQHMRVRANLTGKEYAVLLAWLRRIHDVPPPGQSVVPSPKRFIFSQPISELREQQPKTRPNLPAGPRPGADDEAGVGQPAVGNAPREGR